jgi:hypothetical protein
VLESSVQSRRSLPEGHRQIKPTKNTNQDRCISRCDRCKTITAVLALVLSNAKNLTNPFALRKGWLLMSIKRVVLNAIEFFTILATGESGMSESGLARICKVNHKAIQRILRKLPLATSKLSECLEPFRGKPFELRLRGENNERIIRSDVCAAIIEYYAFESRRKPAEALFAYRKFAKMGIEAWIQSITGWTPAIAATEPTFEAVEKFINDRLPTGTLAAAIHPGKILQMLQECNFSASGYQLYLYLEIMHLQGKEPSITTICQDLKITRATFRKWLQQIQDWSHCADWIVLTPHKTGKELIIQQRLHKELGGTMEAKTPIGPVDLLTKTEIIEIKKIADWKEALGQVVAKALGFPNHQKRIHLFGTSSTILKKVTTHCQPLDVLVTFEKITESPTIAK